MKSTYNRKPRKSRGTAIAEAAASMVIMIPLMVLLMFVTLEVSYACFVVSNLSQAAREGARALSIGYGGNPDISGDRGLQDSLVFDHIRIANIINDSAQFDNPVFQTGAVPHTVTVTVHYKSGQYGLPIFPYPDPLNLGQQFPLQAQHTYRLE